ncbi:MAG: SGNH/GDSL hydrolase family protein, partial [Actinomycetota bacterium]
VGIALARFEPGLVPSYLILAAGVAGLAVGALLTWQILRLPELVLLAVAIVAAIGAWFVFRGEALIAVLLLGFVFAWVLVDRTTGEPTDPNPEAELTIVAFGDSYISGEGAPRYFPDTNVPGIGNNACRRAPTAYPWLAADRLDASLIFLSCSGARTVDMDNTPTPRALPDPLGPIPGGEDQVQRLLASYADRIDDTDAVLVSIGGNDVFFGNIVQACLLPQTCAVEDRTGPWLDNAREIEDTLVDTYQLLRDTFGADTPIVAVQYPMVVRPVDGCRIVISEDEIEFIIEFTETLNGSIERAAARAGINVYGGGVDAFDGRGLCDDDPATNSLHLSPTEGAFLDQLSPANWVHGSMHPRADGHALMAEGLVSDPDDGPVGGLLVDLIDGSANGGAANPEPNGDPDVGHFRLLEG